MKQNKKYRGMFEIQSPKNMTSSGENGLNIKTNESPKWNKTSCPVE